MLFLDGIQPGLVYGSVRFTHPINYPSQAVYRDMSVIDSFPLVWKLPPPDGIWYDIRYSSYGPVSHQCRTGDLKNTTNYVDYPNDCLHRKVDGSYTFLGQGGSHALRMRSGPGYTSREPGRVEHDAWYSLEGQPAYYYAGKSASLNQPYVTDYTGSQAVKISLSTKTQDLWYNQSSYLIPDGEIYGVPAGTLLYEPGKWYLRNVRSPFREPIDGPLEAVHQLVEFERTEIDCVVRHRYCEYHTHASYTPAEQISRFHRSTGLGYCNQATYQRDVQQYLAVMSPSPGIFYVRVSEQSFGQWDGWSPWKPFSGELSSERVREAILVTGDVVASEAALPFTTVERAVDAYCISAEVRASELEDPSGHSIARSRAVADVTELDSNWIENLADVPAPADVFGPLLDGAKACENGDLRAARKALSSAYLAYKYVVAPTLSDTSDVSDNGKRMLDLATRYRFANERRRGSHSCDLAAFGYDVHIDYWCTLHLRLKDNAFSSLWAGLEKIGLDPSSSQMWDLVPFSFVVDWFAKVGPALQTIDAYNSAIVNRECKANVETIRVEWALRRDDESRILPGWKSYGAPSRFVWYNRVVSKAIGDVDPFAGQDNGGPTVSQWVQGASLISNYL